MAGEWAIDQPESFTVGDLTHGHIVMDPSGLHAYATDGVTVVFGVDTATGTVTIVAGPASVIPGATVTGAVASSTTATNLAGGGTAAGTTTISGQLIVGSPTGAHVVIGTDTHGADGVRLYASDGITPLIDLNIAGTPTVTGALIRTAATGSRIEMSASALQTLKWFTGDPGEATNGYVASGLSAAYWPEAGNGGDMLSLVIEPPRWTLSNPVIASVEVHSGDRAANHGAWALISSVDRTGFHAPGVSVDGDQQVVDIGDSVGPRSAGFPAGALQVITIVGIEQVNIAKSQGATIIAQFDGLSGSGKLHWDGASLTVPGNVRQNGYPNGGGLFFDANAGASPGVSGPDGQAIGFTHVTGGWLAGSAVGDMVLRVPTGNLLRFSGDSGANTHVYMSSTGFHSNVAINADAGLTITSPPSTIVPAAASHWWRVLVSGTVYKIPLCPDNG